MHMLFFFKRKYVVPGCESSGIMLELADMYVWYTLQSWQFVPHISSDIENIGLVPLGGDVRGKLTDFCHYRPYGIADHELQ